MNWFLPLFNPPDKHKEDSEIEDRVKWQNEITVLMQVLNEIDFSAHTRFQLEQISAYSVTTEWARLNESKLRITLPHPSTSTL